MYLEHLSVVIKWAGWCVSKIYSRFTLEQECFKNNFILMNQKSRKEEKKTLWKKIFANL